MEIMEYVNVSTKNPSWLPKDPKGISSLTNQKVIPSDFYVGWKHPATAKLTI